MDKNESKKQNAISAQVYEHIIDIYFNKRKKQQNTDYNLIK